MGIYLIVFLIGALAIFFWPKGKTLGVAGSSTSSTTTNFSFPKFKLRFNWALITAGIIGILVFFHYYGIDLMNYISQLSTLQSAILFGIIALIVAYIILKQFWLLFVIGFLFILFGWFTEVIKMKITFGDKTQTNTTVTTSKPNILYGTTPCTLTIPPAGGNIECGEWLKFTVPGLAGDYDHDPKSAGTIPAPHYNGDASTLVYSFWDPNDPKDGHISFRVYCF